MMEKNEQLFFDIMFERYNKWNRLEWKELQDFVDNLINVWLTGFYEEIEYEICKKEFIDSYKPKRLSKAMKELKFNAMWLAFWPKLISLDK